MATRDGRNNGAAINFTVDEAAIASAVTKSVMESFDNVDRAVATAVDQLGRALKENLRFDRYFDDADKLSAKFSDAFSKFVSDESVENAAEFVKYYNALSAKSEETARSVSGSLKDFDTYMAKATGLFSDAGKYSTKSFKEMFVVFESLKATGIDVKDVFGDIFSNAASVEELTKHIEVLEADQKRLNDELDRTRDRLGEVSGELFDAQSNGKINEFNSLIRTARNEFNAFLTANNIDRYDSRLTDIFDDIEAGAITSGEAITRLKTELPELLPRDASIGIEPFLARMEEVLTKIDEMQASIRGLGTVSPQSGISTGAVEGTEAITHESEAVRELVEQSPAVQDFATILASIIKLGAESGGEASDLNTQITPLVDTLRSLADVDAGKLQSLGRVFSGLASINGIKIHPAAMNNLQTGLEGISRIQDTGALKELSTVDFRKFNELKPNKAALENLATYLPVIAGVDVDNLKKLEGLDLSAFNGLKVPDIATDSISNLAEFGRALTETVTGVDKLRDSLNVAGVSGAASLQNLVNNGLSRGQIGSVLKSSLGANGTFTTKTSLQHIGMTADEADRIATQLGEMYGNIKNVSAEWKTFADGSRDAAVITVKAIGDVGETLSQKLIYTLREVKDEAGNVRKEWKLDEVGKVSVDYSAVEKSLADSQKLADQMANGREAAAKQRLAEEQKIADAEKKAAQDAIDAEYKRAEAAVEADKKAYEAFVREQEAKERAAQKEYEAAMKVAEARQQAEEKQNASDEERKIAELGDQYESLADSIEKSATALRGPWSEVSDEHKNDLLEIQNALQTSKEWYDNGLLSTEDYAEVLKGLTQAYNTLDRAVQESSVSQKKAATEERKATKETLDSLNARRSVNNEVRNATRILSEYSAAEHSHNQSSREAYQNIDIYRGKLQELNAQYSAGEITLEEYNQKWREYSGEVSRNAAIIELNGDAHMTAFGKIGRAIKTHLTTLSATTIIGTIIREIRQMVEAVKEIDTSMTELRKVTDETDARYEKFLTDAATRAKALSATISDTVSATADFARLGLSIDEAEAAADAAIVYKSVGDNIESIGDAAESIISTMKAFGVEATDAMSIVDKFNKVGKELCPAA